MKSIILREINLFFGSAIGYLVIALFLITTGLFLWVFDGDFNILNSGFADLSPFFTLAPWIFIFLIPAVTMKSFSDERRLGTLELLLTKPISIWEIVGGKFLGSLILILIALLPSVIYIKVIDILTAIHNTIDIGSILGSYFGLLFVVAAYASIGVFTSTLSENQIVSFILSVFLCFLFYFGLEGFANLLPFKTDFIVNLGMQEHFKSMSRGVLDSRDILYFLSITIIFLYATVCQLKSFKA